MERVLSGLGNRVFLMNNVHEDQPVVFQTRWAMSYLRGPLTRQQITQLMAQRKGGPNVPVGQGASRSVGSQAMPGGDRRTTLAGQSDQRPVLPPEVTERFAARRANLPQGASVLYRPALLGSARVHFAQAASGVDVWQDVSLLVPIDESLPSDVWAEAEDRSEDAPELESQPDAGAKFAALPGELSRPKRYSELGTALKDLLYRNRKLKIFKCAALKETSKVDESEADFRVRLSHGGREQRDAQVEKLRQKYAPKIATLDERIRKAQIKVEKEKSQASQQTMNTMFSFGASILGAVFGRKLASTANVTRAASSMRQAGKIMRERQDISDAAEGVEVLQQQLADLNSQFETETETLQAGLAPDSLSIEEVLIQPKKADISVQQVSLVWLPWIVRMDGALEPGT
jgi:hypothetical protein